MLERECLTINPAWICLLLEPKINSELHVELRDCRFYADTPHGRQEVYPIRISFETIGLAYEIHGQPRRIFPSKRLPEILDYLGYTVMGEQGHLYIR